MPIKVHLKLNNGEALERIVALTSPTIGLDNFWLGLESWPWTTVKEINIKVLLTESTAREKEEAL